MPDERSDSVYSSIGVLCESLSREFLPHDASNETCVRRLKSKAYEILLKKSQNRAVIDENEIDPIRELDIKQFQFRIESRNNPEKKLACRAFSDCLNFVATEPFFETEYAKAILTFILTLADSNRDKQDANVSQVGDLLIPGPFTLHASHQNISHYPTMPHNTPILSTTFKTFQMLKDHRNLLDEPRIAFHEEPRKFDSAFSLASNTPRRPTSAISTKSHETWKCGLSIDPSSCRFFNLVSSNASSTTSKVESKNKVVAAVFNSDSSNVEIVSSQPTVRHTFSWNWEALGQATPLEAPFASETNSILHMHATRANNLRETFEAKIVQFDRFLTDLKNVTIGIQSDSFKCNNQMIFCLEPNITIATASPKVMEKFVVPFIECGSCYKRLQIMIAKKNVPFVLDGFIFKATCGAVEEYLIKFRQFVVLHKDSTLLQFYKRLKKMMNQVAYLAHVFAIHPNVDPDIRPPMGSQFLGYIYKEITGVTQKDITMLLVYILKQCCYAYYKYLQKWIFYGVLDDPRSELFICFVDHYRPNTKHFFDKAYYVRKESVPGFLQGYEDQILQCGKYTMLLKAYNPTHPVFELEYPSISVCLSFEEIHKMERNCHDYIARARQKCGQPVSAGDIFRERKEARQKFKEMVLKKSRLTFEKWAVDCENLVAEETARKRKRLEELQAHLKEVRERKIAEKKTDLALDLKVLKEVQEIEDKRIAQENVEIQKRIEYYQQLNAIIEERQNRADLAMVTTSSNVRIETDPGTPVSSATEFESCLGDDEEDTKSVYEDATVTADFADKFLETEKKLNELFAASAAVSNNNSGEIRRSGSDVLNSNEVVVSDLKQNRLKVLGSSISNFYGCADNDGEEPSSTQLKAPLTEAQKIKIKVLSSEYGIDLNRNETLDKETIAASKQTTTTTLTDLEANRKKMMQNDPFAKLNEGSERRKLQLDLGTEFSRNRRRVLESEYNILTGASNHLLTPMSTTSDSPVTDEHEDDLENANVLKLIVPPPSGDKWNLKTPDLEMLTAETIEETPECALNTAGIMVKQGFDFDRAKITSDGIITTLDSSESVSNAFSGCGGVEISTNPSDEFKQEFKWKLVSDLLSLKRNSNKHSNGADGGCTNLPTDKKLNDLNVITLTEFLQKSVVVPLSAHLAVLNCEIMRLYLQELNILDHFKSLRNYFCLMDGEFGSIVCVGLISKLENGAQPSELLSYRMLHTILDNALCSSIIGNDKNSDNVSFIVDEMPERFDLASPECLSTLSLSYRVSWPVNLILNPETLEKYSKIFKYLIKVRRISWVLEEAYQRLKEAVKKNGKEMLRSPQYRRVQQIRHKFFHFVHALNNHITSSALQASWKTFKDDLVSAKSIEDIYRKHANYIKRILFLCMLNKKSVEFYNAIENIFKVTLRFSRNLKSREWKRKPNDESYTHSRYERLLADEAEFEKCIKYTIYLGNKIVRHGYQEEIGQFISLINFNQYYLIDM